MNAWNHGEAISFLINFAFDSLKIKSLKIEKKIRGKKRFVEERPYVHVLLTAPKGQLKSTVLRELSSFHGTPVFTDVSFAALVGSIDKDTKQVMPAGAWHCRNNFLILDEWNFRTDGHDDTLKALLQLTESGEFSRRLARYAAAFESDKNELPLYFMAKDGAIRVKTRFSLVLASMYDLTRRTQKDTEALISRMIPYHYEMSREELNAYAAGKEILHLAQKENVPLEVKIKHSRYKKILSYCAGAKDENFLRTVGDVARCFAIYGWKPALFDFIIERKNIAENNIQRAREQNAERYAGLVQNQRIQQKPEEV